MSNYPDNPGPLPAEKLCNSSPPYNPIKGDGALGNQYRGRMFYKGNDREELVKTLQNMLIALGFDVGPSGIDGKFGDDTEKAVKQFQEKNKNYDGNELKVDGLVGPDTSDALNREMVGRWYDEYTTPLELTQDFKMVTVTSEKLRQSCTIGIKTAEKIKKIKIEVIGDISPRKKETVSLIIQLLDITVIPFQPMGITQYRLEINDPNFAPVDAQTDDKGILSVEIPKSAKTGRLILDQLTYDLIITDIGRPDSLPGAVVRLRNLGYPDLPSLISEESGNAGPSECPVDDPVRQALMQFQFDNGLPPTGELNQDTVKKMEDVYGC